MSHQSLTIRAFEEPGRYVLTLSGDLDMASAPGFEAAATRLAGMGRSQLLVEISDIAFIDSMGVRAILAVKAVCERHSCELSMTHAADRAERVFELTRLRDHLPFGSKRETPRFRREIDLWSEGSRPGDQSM